MTKTDPHSILNATGFPLQVAIEQAIQEADKNESEFPWSVWADEYAWRHTATGESGFLDLVLLGKISGGRFDYSTVFATVEVKSFKGEKPMVFLKPERRWRQRAEIPLIWLLGSTPPIAPQYVPSDIAPEIPAARFSVLPDGNNKRMLESLAGDLLAGTEALALQLQSQQFFKDAKDPVAFVPILVTNARLILVHAPADALSPESAVLTDAPHEEVPAVALVKPLRSELAMFTRSLDLWSLPGFFERAILVVSAKHVLDFLRTFKLLRFGAVRDALDWATNR